MGGFAVVLTSITLVYGVLIARSDRAPRDPALRAGVVVGLVMTFVLTMVFAGYLGSNGSHFVGGGNSDAGGLAADGLGARRRRSQGARTSSAPMRCTSCRRQASSPGGCWRRGRRSW